MNHIVGRIANPSYSSCNHGLNANEFGARLGAGDCPATVLMIYYPFSY